MDGDPYVYVPPPARARLGPILLGLLLAFAIGIVLTGVALRRYPGLARTVLPTTTSGSAASETIAQPVASAALPASPAPEPAPSAALAGKVEELSDRVEEVDQRATQASGDADRAEGMLVAFAARRALDRGQPLGFLEGMLRQRFGARDAASVATVIASAQRPVTMAMLQDRLAQIAPTLQAAPTESWWTGFRREMGSLFVVRRAGAVSPLPADRLARAGHALDSGQADVALTEVARLPASTAQTEWTTLARRYILARNALDRIETEALLSPRVGGATGLTP